MVLLPKRHDFLSTWGFFQWIHAFQGTESPKPVVQCSVCLRQFSRPASSKPRVPHQVIEYNEEGYPTPLT